MGAISTADERHSYDEEEIGSRSAAQAREGGRERGGKDDLT